MTSPVLVAQHKFDSGALPLQNRTAQVNDQSLNIGEYNRRTCGVSENSVYGFLMSALHRRMLSKTDSILR